MSKSASQQELDNVQAMRDLSKLPENCRCADCDARDPDWASINLGIFICIKCAGIHRNLGVHHSKVRSIELDTNCWDEEMIAYMKSMGNEKARNMYEKRAPMFWIRPKEFDLNIVRERWIRAKYEKKLFVKNEIIAEEKEGSGGGGDGDGDGAASAAGCNENASAAASSSSAVVAPVLSRGCGGGTGGSIASSGTGLNGDPANYLAPEHALEGWLCKENRNKKWQKRWFLLWGRELHYYKDANDSYEKGRLDVVHCRISIPDSSGAPSSSVAASGSGSAAPNGFRYLFELISTEQDRSYPLAAETEDEMFNWLHAVRRAQLFYTKVAKGEEQMGMVAKQADIKIPFARLPSIMKRGFLSKQGGSWSSWNKRYFVLANDVLYYYKQQPADIDLPEGGICVDSADIQLGEERVKRKYVFTILTPDRSYFIQANNEAEMNEWMAALLSITDESQKRRQVDFSDSRLRS